MNQLLPSKYIQNTDPLYYTTFATGSLCPRSVNPEEANSGSPSTPVFHTRTSPEEKQHKKKQSKKNRNQFFRMGNMGSILRVELGKRQWYREEEVRGLTTKGASCYYCWLFWMEGHTHQTALHNIQVKADHLLNY